MITEPKITVRPITPEDIPHIVKYWLCSDHEYLRKMGVDISKLPSKNQLVRMLKNQIETPIANKKSYALICCKDDQAIGHCNILDINFGVDANMHLHLWKKEFHQKGMGTIMVRESVKMFFKSFNLQRITSEPYSLNPAPHKVLLKVGFKQEKEYITTPGSLSFRQKVVRYVMTRDQYEAL